MIGENPYDILFTSVTGHLMNNIFPSKYKEWDKEKIKDLYDGKS